MRKVSPFFVAVLLCSFFLPPRAGAQGATGTLDLLARINPTAARPEPVRQFTLYVLTRSYTDIAKEVEAQDVIPSRDKFIDALRVSPQLRDWLKAHDVLDLTSPNLDQVVTPDDVIRVPEFFAAYQRSNSGGVTPGIPKPKYRDADKTENPARYEQQYAEYLAALKKFMQTHPGSIAGIELELNAVNPQTQWSQIQADHRRRVLLLAPEIAQAKYLAAQVDTDLDGHAAVSNLPAGNYWISTLNLDAGAGDVRVRWDVPVAIQAGRTSRIELTNLNAIDTHGARP